MRPLESAQERICFQHVSGQSANLDWLRAYAVGLVLADHLLLAFDAKTRGAAALGFLGVILFFIHTSLVLMLSIDRSLEQNSALILPFFCKRFFRIYPLSVVCVAVSVVTGFTTLSPSDLFSNLTLTMNLMSAKAAIDPMWSLPYEVQMYLLLPFLHRMAHRWESAWATAALLLPLGILALIQQEMSMKLDLIRYMGFFMAGIVAYQLSWRTRMRWPWWLWPLMLMTATASFVLISSFRWQPDFLWRWIFCLIIAILLPRFQQIPSGMISRISHTVATYSYGIYLTHTFVIYIVFVKLTGWPVAARAAIFVFLMAALPYAAYHLVEKPFIELGKRVSEQDWIASERPILSTGPDAWGARVLGDEGELRAGQNT